VYKEIFQTECVNYLAEICIRLDLILILLKLFSSISQVKFPSILTEQSQPMFLCSCKTD